jgi:hypothetical protein
MKDKIPEELADVMPDILDKIKNDVRTDKMANALMDVLREDKTIFAGTEALRAVIEGGTTGQIMCSMAIMLASVINTSDPHHPEEHKYQAEAFYKLLLAVQHANTAALRTMKAKKK